MEYAKLILPKVSAWEGLFKKELLKCVNWVRVDELHELGNWCYNKFGEIYPEILDEVFAGTTYKIESHVMYKAFYSGNSHQLKIKKRSAVAAV